MKKFLKKLFHILDVPSSPYPQDFTLSSIIRWNPTGEYILIIDPQGLEK